MPATELERGDFIERIAARVQMAGGHVLEGYLLAEKGGGERLTDICNSQDEWFRFEHEGALYWVSKKHLITLEPTVQ